MSNKELISAAEDLRKRADCLVEKAGRPLPKRWEVGQRVRFLNDSEWAWSKGGEATINRVSDNCHRLPADEYQVFWTEPDSKNASWWTTPNDVELVAE